MLALAQKLFRCRGVCKNFHKVPGKSVISIAIFIEMFIKYSKTYGYPVEKKGQESFFGNR
jgi:hypothetical protein